MSNSKPTTYSIRRQAESGKAPERSTSRDIREDTSRRQRDGRAGDQPGGVSTLGVDGARRPPLAEWLASQGWHVRLDLTFRAGTDACDVAEVSAARAGRRLRAFMRRLADDVHANVTYFAAPEMQLRGVRHWHVLVRFHRRRCPWLVHARVSDLWQYWKTWTTIDKRQGVEGFMWMKFITCKADCMYAAKYVTKCRGDWMLETWRVSGLFGCESISSDVPRVKRSDRRNTAGAVVRPQ